MKAAVLRAPIVGKVVEMVFPTNSQVQRAAELIHQARIPSILDVLLTTEGGEYVLHVMLEETKDAGLVYDIIGRIYVALSSDESVGLVPRLANINI
ncbi:MAG TPA: hypothetical protein VFS14_00070 [Candidatus Saccharimonadales bacterium]|nr:hypothetical protein [Candidatus Saccharimonadales bacterium]